MKVLSISFGKKMPIMKCNIRDVWQNKSAEATLYEYDCKDYSDVNEVRTLCGNWAFGQNVAYDMYKSHGRYLEGKERYPMNFYVMQDKYNKIIGLCETTDTGKDTNVEFIESDSESGYKYIGQTMLAMVGKRLLNRGGEKLRVEHPYSRALPFYIDKCGFDSEEDNNNGFALFMNNHKVKEFIDGVQRKTHAPIREIKE